MGKIRIENHQLLVSFSPEMNAFESIDRKRTWRQEFRMPAFERSFDIHPNIVDPDTMELIAEDGIISITFYKREELEGRMLPVVPFSLN